MWVVRLLSVLSAACLAAMLTYIGLGSSTPAEAQTMQSRILGVTGGNGGFDCNDTYTSCVASGLRDSNSRAQAKHRIYNFFNSLNHGNPRGFYDAVAAEGAVPMATIYPESTRDLDDVNNGYYDSQLDYYAREIAAHDGPVLVRPMHEMNSNWASWTVGAGDNSPEEYIQAFRRIHNKIESVAPNAQWVFSPNIRGHGLPGDVPLANVFPGDSYVDWLALDGYNWAHSRGLPWKNFTELFRDSAYNQDSYSELAALSNDRMMIAETSSVEHRNDPGRKGQWIKNAYLSAVPQNMPRIEAIVFFHVDRTVEEGVDFRFNTSASSRDAYRRVASDPGWQGTLN